MPQQISVVGCNIVDEEGIFKATVLWDKIVTYLEESIKCGRHTQSLKTYTNCFQGSKAVECLLVHLNAVQPKPVKRCQVQTLCQKLVLTGVIEDVKDKGVFREGRLYRLTRNHFWANPTERKLPRTRSAEEICAEKASDCDDLKGYASDSTVSHQTASKDKHTPLHRNKRRHKERGGGGQQEVHHVKDLHKSSPLPIGSQFPPLNLGMLRMKSTGSILHTPDCTPSSMLCESRENLLCFDTSRHRHKTSAGLHHRPSRPEPSYATLSGRRRSVDNGIGKVCGACGGVGATACKPPRRGAKTKDDPRHVGKERTLRNRHQSRSLKGEKDRSRKHSPQEEQDCASRRSSLNRSLSFSSVGDYEGAEANFEPLRLRHHSSISGSKWIVYGYF